MLLTFDQVVPASNLDKATDCSVPVCQILPTQISEQQLSYVTISVFRIFSKSPFIFPQLFQLNKGCVVPAAGICAVRSAASIVNYTSVLYKLHKTLGCYLYHSCDSVYHLLWFLHVRCANQPAVHVVTLRTNILFGHFCLIILQSCSLNY
jgi:hypothetical protein